MKKRLLIIGVLLFFALLLTGITIINLMTKEQTTLEQVKALVVVIQPWRGNIHKSLYYSGTLQPANIITVISKVPGKIEQIMVEEGDLIRKGDVLVKIEQDVVDLEMNQAYSAWQAAQAQYEKAKKGPRVQEIENVRALVEQGQKDFIDAEQAFERAQRLFESGTISKTQYEEYERIYRSAKTQLENAERSLRLMEEGASVVELAMAEAQAQAMEAQYQLAQLKLGYTQIQAPMAGVVAQIFVDEGNLVGQTVPILVIMQDNPIIMEIPMPEKHYGYIQKNREQLTAHIIPSAYDYSLIFNGVISNISPIINPQSRTFTIEITIDNSESRLRPGMYANVEFIVENYEDALLVPKSAILEYNGKPHIFLITKHSPAFVQLKEIQVGIKDSKNIQVLSGLTGTETIISEGNAFLVDGQEVRILEP